MKRWRKNTKSEFRITYVVGPHTDYLLYVNDDLKVQKAFCIDSLSQSAIARTLNGYAPVESLPIADKTAMENWGKEAPLLALINRLQEMFGSDSQWMLTEYAARETGLRVVPTWHLIPVHEEFKPVEDGFISWHQAFYTAFSRGAKEHPSSNSEWKPTHLITFEEEGTNTAAKWEVMLTSSGKAFTYDDWNLGMSPTWVWRDNSWWHLTDPTPGNKPGSIIVDELT